MKKLNICIEYNNNNYNLYCENQILKTTKNNFFDLKNKKLAIFLKNKFSLYRDSMKIKNSSTFQLLSFAVDEVRNNKKKYLNELFQYIDTDLICYRVQEPEDLAKLHNKFWGNVLNTLKKK